MRNETNLQLFERALGTNRVYEYLKAELPAEHLDMVYTISDGVQTHLAPDGKKVKYLCSYIGISWIDPAGCANHGEFCLSAHDLLFGHELSVA